MATRRKPQVKKIKFELTRSSIAGIGIVLFCIFLWMFLLGVWTGQSLLQPATRSGDELAAQPVAQPAAPAGPEKIEAQLTKKIVE